MSDDKVTLIIDENQDSAKITRATVNALGITPLKTISDLEQAKEFIFKNKILIIIIELTIHGESTLDLVRWIRRTSTNPNLVTPIIALTSNATKETVTSARDAGVTEFVLKPFTSAALNAAIVSSIKNPRNFIISRGFVGPDRRRRHIEPPDGSEKRKPPGKKD